MVTIMTISEKLAALREKMRRNRIDMYYIPTDDFHGSEYVGGYFKCREYISGFTGSAGSVVITQNYAGLWTDGRYYIQAEKQLAGTEYVLNKAGSDGVPSVTEFILKNIDGGILGFDGRVVSAEMAEKLADELCYNHIKANVDLIGDIWSDRPPLSTEKAYVLDEKYAGESAASKIKRIREMMKQKKADIFLLTSPDDICWLLNIRGNDIDYNPVVLSYLEISDDMIMLFADKSKLSDEVITALDKVDVDIYPYDDFYRRISGIPEGVRVYLDNSRINYAVKSALPKNLSIINGQNLTLLPKAIKNSTETENIIKAHIKDGVAVTKFIYEIKNHPEKYTELSAAKLIIDLRSKQEHYIEESFEPITAYGAHAAIVHYTADDASDVQLKADGFFLCDTGGHYLEGTTDVTRTICLGNPTDEMKAHYTAVLRGHLALANAKFLYGCRGANLDILARGPLWEQCLNYNHGTGHGVGYTLNVHEGPNGIRWKIPDNASKECIFEEGMVTSDEPGLYIEGKYGIRTENLLLCRNGEKNEYGRFMHFDNLTLVPYDPDAIAPELLSDSEKKNYNTYQQRVYDTVSPYLTDDEKAWLKNETRAI